MPRRPDQRKQPRDGRHLALRDPQSAMAQGVALSLGGPAADGEKCPNDVLLYLFDILVAAENVDSLDLVVDYLAWAGTLLVNLGGPAERFTDREREVLAMLLKGLPDREIGRLLMIEVSAVKARLRGIYKKWGLLTGRRLSWR